MTLLFPYIYLILLYIRLELYVFSVCTICNSIVDCHKVQIHADCSGGPTSFSTEYCFLLSDVQVQSDNASTLWTRFSLLLFVATNKKLFSHNSQIHDINTRHNNNNLHLPLTGLTLVQKGVAYCGCKIFKHLPPQIKNILNNVPLFKSKLKKLLLRYVFYSVDEYYQQNYKDYEW